ncbi:MAG: alternative oxidase [Pseudonocardiaceae bacterium]
MSFTGHCHHQPVSLGAREGSRWLARRPEPGRIGAAAPAHARGAATGPGPDPRGAPATVRNRHADPVQAWEQIAFITITHVHTRTGMARRIHDRVATSRAQQDNEMFHLLIIEGLIARAGLPQPRIKFFWLPQAIAFVYYQLSWLLFAVRPSWSYRLNADFEDHAEHEYMTMATEHPEWESESFESEFDDDFGHFASLADVFRQIAHDERMHKLESEALMKEPRFR